MKKFTLFALLAICPALINAQSACGNKDFEDTTFTNWTGATGMNPGSVLTPNTSWVNGIVTTGPNAGLYDPNNQMTLITQNYLDSIAIDPATSQPDTQMTSLAPGGGFVSVRLGNAVPGAQCERLAFPYAITAQNTYLQYQFATVMEDPGHPWDGQPFFIVNLWDQANNLIPCCSDTIWSADPSYPFINMGNVQYRRWTPVSIDLSAYVGQTITVEFINSDCGYSGHYGYTYIDLSCIGSAIASVWPGDTDYDLQANNYDVLCLGIAYGATGTARAGASNTWMAQASSDWGQSFALGTNYKHSDCNGDGTVDLNDTLAIVLNYAQTHPFRLANPNNDMQNPAAVPSISLVPVNDTVGPFNYVDVDIYLGSAAQPVNSLYGVSFDVAYDNALVQPGTVTTNFSGSWLGVKNSSMIALDHNDFASGMNGIGMCRITQTELNGNGYLGRMRFAVENVGTITTLPLSAINIRAIDLNNVSIPVNAGGTDIVIDPSLPAGISTPAENIVVNLYPNPATDNVVIGTATIAQSITITDALGRELFRTAPTTETTTIDLGGFATGMYFITVVTESGIATRELIVAE